MKWHATRKALVRIYAAGFVLLGLLLIYSALFGAPPHRVWMYSAVGIAFLAEGAGLALFQWIARLTLKALLAAGALFFVSGMLSHAAWEMVLLPVAFAGLFFLEIAFLPVDRRIAAGRAEKGGRA